MDAEAMRDCVEKSEDARALHNNSHEKGVLHALQYVAHLWQKNCGTDHDQYSQAAGRLRFPFSMTYIYRAKLKL